jgi:hypothetical protein
VLGADKPRHDAVEYLGCFHLGFLPSPDGL